MAKSIIFILLWLGLVATGTTLGVWQLDRLAWKNDYLAQIAAAYPDPLSTWPDIATDKTLMFARVRAPVAFQSEIYWIRPKFFAGAFGGYLYQRAVVEGRSVWVLRGFVADSGTARPAQSGVMTLQIRNTDVTADVVLKLNKNLPADVLRTTPVDLVAVVEDAQARDGPYPWAVAGDRPTPRNNHLAYAIFWFTMSGILLVGGIFMVMRGRSRSAPSIKS